VPENHANITFDNNPVAMKNEQEFLAGGVVSVWIGNFQTEAQLDDYMNLSRDFEVDFGFRINDRGIREAVVQAAKRAGIKQATAMIVFYTVRFDPTKVTTNPNAPLKFLGVFPFSR
jgi:hypothetical protein